jgi:hypothetical protein
LSPADNLRTYPVYRPNKEPPGYWEDLQKKKPEPIVDVSKIRTRQDWVDAAVPGLEFLTKLSPEDKAALIAFLRSL